MKALSASDSPGFTLLQNKENGFYYFQFNDTGGKPVLLSNDFPNKELAKKKMQDAIRLAKHERNYSRKKEGEYYHFMLMTGNKQELARSVPFVNEKELRAKIDSVREFANLRETITESNKANAPEDASVSSQAPILHAAHSSMKPQSRYAFKIELHWREDDQAYPGRIIELLSDESAIFRGVDENTIGQFIRDRLPANNDREAGTPVNATLQLLASSYGPAVHSIEAGQPLLYFLLRCEDSKNKDYTLV